MLHPAIAHQIPALIDRNRVVELIDVPTADVKRSITVHLYPIAVEIINFMQSRERHKVRVIGKCAANRTQAPDQPCHETGAMSYVPLYDDHGRRDPLWPLVTSSGAVMNYESEVFVCDLVLEGIIAEAGWQQSRDRQRDGRERN